MSESNRNEFEFWKNPSSKSNMPIVPFCQRKKKATTLIQKWEKPTSRENRWSEQSAIWIVLVFLHFWRSIKRQKGSKQQPSTSDEPSSKTTTGCLRRLWTTDWNTIFAFEFCVMYLSSSEWKRLMLIRSRLSRTSLLVFMINIVCILDN